MEIREEIPNSSTALLTLHGISICRQDIVFLHGQIGRLAEKGIARVVVDLSNVKWFGAAMLGVLIASLQTLREVGGDLRLTGNMKRTSHILNAAHLDDILKTSDTVDEAVAELQEHLWHNHEVTAASELPEFRDSENETVQVKCVGTSA